MEENRETILDELTSFEKKNPKEITPILEDYLLRIAKTGDTMFPWNKLKPLFLHKMEKVISEFYETCPSEDLSSCPNVEKFCFESMKEKLLEAIDNFSSAPFTIQRLCELITTPRKHYKRTDKFLRGLEKNVLVVSTVEPGCSHIFACDCSSKRRERDSVPMVNGIVDPPASVNGMSDFTSFTGKGSLNTSTDFISIFPESGHEDSKPYSDIEKDNSVDVDKDVNLDTSNSMVIDESDSSNHQSPLSDSTHFQETAEVKQEVAATSSVNEESVSEKERALLRNQRSSSQVDKRNARKDRMKNDSVSSSLSNETHHDSVDSLDNDIADSNQINNEIMSPVDSQQNNPDSNMASQSNELILSDNKEIEEPSEDEAAVVSSKEESPPDSSTETEKIEDKVNKEVELEHDDICDTTPSEKEERVPVDSNDEMKDTESVNSPCSNEITTTSSSSSVEEIEKLDSSVVEQSDDKTPDSSEAEESNISKTPESKEEIELNVEVTEVEEKTLEEVKEETENKVEPMEQD